jgi:hypothetical protein
VPKSRNPKTLEAEQKAREELQHPDMTQFDRAMRALLKVSGKKQVVTQKTRQD